MSTPENPLDQFQTVTFKHILVGFQYSKDADTTNFSMDVGVEGSVIGGDCGPGVVIVNEFKGDKFFINNAVWEYNFYSPTDMMNTSNVGTIEISEKVGISFIDFLFNDALGKLGDVNISHVGFALKTFFICSNHNGANTQTITGNQYTFHVSNILSSANDISPRPNTHTLMTMGTAQTVGQLPAYSNIYQMTLTHKDGNLHKEVPKPEAPSCGLQLRGAEDGAKYPAREERLEKSKPMLTLKDAFEAFEVDLDEQKFAHKAQLQQWLRNVRDDHVDKIEVPPIQRKQPFGDYLPVNYMVALDPEYQSYQIDNRNMPFEQPDQDQTKNGIRSLGIEPSATIGDAVRKILCLSKKIGEDANLSPAYVPKISISVVRMCEGKFDVFIKIKKIQLPENSLGIDTGPGEGGVNPLTFYVNDNADRDRDVLSLDSKVTYVTGSDVLEKHVDDPDANVIYGNREQVTAERSRDIPYFETMNSGMRLMLNAYNGNGTEQGDLASAADSLSSTQFSFFNITIKGNPYLMYDVNRKHLEVANDVAGEVHYYQFPEYYPIYAKLIMYEKSYEKLGRSPANEPDLDQQHYYTKYYHVSKVRNVFQVIDESGEGIRGFHQVLEMRRTDDFM